MEICVDVQSEIDQGPIGDKSIGGIHTSEVLNALESEPDGSRNMEYF